MAGIFQKKPDVILATCPTPFVALGGLLLATIRRLPFILEVSDLWPASILAVGVMRENLLIRILEKLELFLYRQAKVIITLTASFSINMVSRGINPKKIKTVTNGVDLARYFPRPKNLELAQCYQFTDKHFIAGYIGTFGMAHALETILYAAELLQQETTIRFLFVGSGAESKKLQQLAAAKSLSNVFFVESQPKELIPKFWSLCDVALISLKNSSVFAEVIPSKIFEAMGMGLSVIIAAPQGEATKLVTKEKIGFSVPPENPQALATALLASSKKSRCWRR